MEYVLLKLGTNWADEFDVESLMICTGEEYQELINDIKKNFKPGYEYYFGTNECVEFDSVEEILDNITVAEISEEFYNTFKELVGTEFGILPLSRFAGW